jgi:hypothetical protein
VKPTTIATTIPITVGVLKPDLIVTEVTAPSSLKPNEKAVISATVKNIGDSTAPYSYVAIYLSRDNVPDSSDLLLRTESVSSLLKGISKKITASVQVPSSSDGSYYILAVADSNSRILEKNEANNVGISNVMRINTAQGTLPGTLPITNTPVMETVITTPKPTTSSIQGIWLSISSSPTGAATSMDGKYIGTTPLTKTDITPGYHSFTFIKDGYNPSYKTLYMRTGEKTSFNVVLIPK